MPKITNLLDDTSAAENIGDHHRTTLLTLIREQDLRSQPVDEFIMGFATSTREAFGLAAAQVWQENTEWSCLADKRSPASDVTPYPSPREGLSPDLTLRTLDCNVATQGDMPKVILRLIKPPGRRWIPETIAISAAYASVLNNAITTAYLRSTIENLNAAKISAEVANRSKTDFLANMSHELRTPLNAIIGFSEILAQEYFGTHSTPQYKEYAQDILLSGQHLLSLINDILDLSRIESGRHHLQEESVKLDEIIHAAIRFVREQAGVKNHTLNIAGVSGINVFGESRAIKQILVNLLSNAIKFTPPNGAITVAVSVADTIRLTVCDTGRGIAPEQLSNLFQPFNRGHENTKQTEEGAGLGLVISRKLAQLHGGDLALQSELDRGTTAIFTLPCNRISSDPASVRPWDIVT